MEVDLKKKKRLLVHHEDKVRDVDAGITNRIKLVIHIKKEKTVRGRVRRQNIRREYERPKHGSHFFPGLALAGR